MKISVIGLGFFGFALLKYLDSLDSSLFSLCAFDRKKDLIESLSKKKQHTLFHQDIRISEKVFFFSSLEGAIGDADVLILCVPSSALSEISEKISPLISKKVIILNTAKAIDRETALPLSRMLMGHIQTIHPFSLAHLAGGTIAHDFFSSQPLGVDIASRDKDALQLLGKIFSSPRLYVSLTTDIEGVELASAYKNVVAVLAGIVSGLGFSYGSETHIISRASEEILSIIKLQGYRISPYAFSSFSQCWGNDMLMSCTGNTRNRNFGIQIGKTRDVKKVLIEMENTSMTIESIPTILSLKKTLLDHKEKFPVLLSLYNIINAFSDPEKSILNIFSLSSKNIREE